MEFKDRLWLLRAGDNLTYSQLAANFNLSEGAVRSWETGRTSPTVKTIVKLANYFNCTTDYLLGLSDIRIYNENEKDKRIANLEDENGRLRVQHTMALRNLEQAKAFLGG